jgi:hypothetical protein
MKKAIRSVSNAALLFVLAVTACAQATAGNGSNTNVLTQEEIMAVGVNNLYEVIQRERPRWLQTRGQRSFGQASAAVEIVVYQNQTLLGGLDMLRQLSPGTALRLRYLDGATAMASLSGLGSRHVGGAIIIETVAR